MAYHVKLSDLANMPVEDSDRVLAELVQSAKAKRNGQRAVMDARIREFEIRYEMSSADLHERLRSGALLETAEIARWLMLLAARENRGSRR
jgi:hypothetical protein